MGSKNLFEDRASADDLSLTVNEEFAARLEHNKAREELHRLQDKHKVKHTASGRPKAKEVDGIEDESSSSEDDDDEDMDVAAELQDPGFLRMLSGFKKGTVVEPATSESDTDEAEDPDVLAPAKRRRKEKPILLKDIPRDAANESSSSDDEEEDEAGRLGRTYNQELEGARRDLLQMAKGVGASEKDTDLFGPARHQEDADDAKERKHKKHKTADTQQMLDDYFGKDEELNEDDLFLKRFISEKGLGDVGDKRQAGSDSDIDEAEDEEHVEAAERFEAAHNFRFEEEGAERIKTYPREIEGVVRQGETKRAEARKRKKEKQQQERARQEAEIQRLKTLKRREIEERMTEIQELAGLGTPSEDLLELLSKEDFNEEEYDKAMAKAFDNNYYEADDSTKPPKDSEDDMEADEDGPVNPGGFRAIQKELKTGDGSSKRDAEEVKRLLEEYNKLDYEDILAGMPTRFKYRQVDTDDFGLDTADILALTDKELNQVVGLRRLAPYRSEHRSKKDDRFAQRQLREVQKRTTKAKRPRENPEEAAPSRGPEPDSEAHQAQEAHRKATYARPSLPSSLPAAAKKRVKPKEKVKEPPQMSLASASGQNTSGMTKSQKKNLLRTLKRKRKASDAS